MDDEDIFKDCLLIIALSGPLLRLLSFVKKLLRIAQNNNSSLPSNCHLVHKLKESRPSNGLWGTRTSLEITAVRVFEKPEGRQLLVTFGGN